jgi:hypothetical protein
MVVVVISAITISLIKILNAAVESEGPEEKRSGGKIILTRLTSGFP